MSASTPNLVLPYPVSADTADVPRDIKALADRIDVLAGPAGIGMVGEIRMWPAVNPPTGWLVCNGTQYPAATYPGLAAVLGQAGGNITLPDYRDTFPMGAGAAAIGSRGGVASVTLSVTQMPSHNHSGLTGARDRSQSHGHIVGSLWLAGEVPGYAYSGPGSGYAPTAIGMTNTDPADHMHPITAQGGGGSHENRPPFAAVNFIIRAG